MSEERGWIVPPRPNPYSVEAWAERHRRDGHHPHPAPTPVNPERWECECPGITGVAVWRILTAEQIRMKFAHLGAAAKARREGRPLPRRVICSLTLTEHCPYEGEEEKGSECKNLADDLPPGGPTGPPLRIAARYAAGRKGGHRQ
jgi:hypothetical protein